MNEWNQSHSGTWSLSLNDRSLTLPDSFVVEHEAKDLIGFVDDGPGLPSCRVVYKRVPAQSFMKKRDNTKHLSTFSVSDVSVTKYAGTTKSGRTELEVRMYVIGLTDNASILVVDVHDRYAQLLADQWAREPADQE